MRSHTLVETTIIGWKTRRSQEIETARNGSRVFQFLPMERRGWRDLREFKRAISNRRVSVKDVTGTQTNCSMALIPFTHRGQRVSFLAQLQICTSSVFLGGEISADKTSRS